MAARTGAEAAPRFVWKDHSRFVEVHPVRTGWLVLWGRYENAGERKLIAGNRTYQALDGARRRLADSVLELTRNPSLAAEAVGAFDRFTFSPHTPQNLPPL